VAGPAAGPRFPGDLHRRPDGEDPGRGGHQPGRLPGHRHRLRRRQAGPGPVGRPRDRRIGEVLDVGPVGGEGPGRRGCMHRVLRRPDRAAGRDQRGLAAGGRSAVRGAPDPRVAAVCLPQVLGAAIAGPAAHLHRRRRAIGRGGAGGVRRRLERPLPGDREGLAGALGRVHAIPGVPARGQARYLHHG
jgi:hypothetical protein